MPRLVGCLSRSGKRLAGVLKRPIAQSWHGGYEEATADAPARTQHSDREGRVHRLFL